MGEPKTPRTVDDLTAEYLSMVAAKLLGEPAVTVTGFTVTPEPFEFPRFGDKQFFEIAFDFSARKVSGRSWPSPARGCSAPPTPLCRPRPAGVRCFRPGGVVFPP